MRQKTILNLQTSGEPSTWSPLVGLEEKTFEMKSQKNAEIEDQIRIDIISTFVDSNVDSCWS